MRKLTEWAAVLLLSAAAGSLAPASAATAASPEVSAQVTQGQGGLPAAKGRLKFKSAGPVCMCAEGLSERDIEQAMAKSKPDGIAGSDSSAGRSQAGSQEKKLNVGGAK